MLQKHSRSRATTGAAHLTGIDGGLGICSKGATLFCLVMKGFGCAAESVG